MGSRRRMTDAIREGRVEVNGVVAESFNHPVDPGRDTIHINGQRVNLKSDMTVCVMLHKPEGVVSTVSDDRGRKTVLDILPEKFHRYRLYPVGRLDINTTGLLLLTNDGDLTYRLMHPKFEQEKEYHVKIKGKLLPPEIRTLEQGIELEDGLTAPAVVKRIYLPDYNYRIVIHEGRKRQVRRMFEHLGHPVTALRRVRVGSLVLGDLPEGQARPLTNREVKSITMPFQPRPGLSKRRRV